MTTPRASLFLFRLLVIALAVITGFRVTVHKILFGIAPDEFALFLPSSSATVAVIRFGFRIKAFLGRFLGWFAALVLLLVASARGVAFIGIGFRIKAFLGRFLCWFASLVLLIVAPGAITVRVRIEASILGV